MFASIRLIIVLDIKKNILNDSVENFQTIAIMHAYYIAEKFCYKKFL